jgi:hypothetical protein
MRLAPAIAGTLLVPAVYFLAAALVPRRTAVVAAAFVACSGWMLTFSREAQSHAPIWLACVAALAIVFVISRRATVSLAIGAILLIAGAAWFARATANTNDLDVLRSTLAFLSGVVIPTREQRIYIPPVAVQWMVGGAVIALLPMLIGIVPWPRRGPKIAYGAEDNTPVRFVLPAVVAAWIGLALIIQRPSFAVPAVALMVAVLLMRIPFAPLRWLSVALVCLVNFLAAAAPVAANVEPPVDQIAHDIWQTRDFAGPARTFVQFRDATPDRGGGTIFNEVGKYYLAVETRGREPIPTVALVTSQRELTDQVAASPQLERLIVWDYFNQAKGIPPETLEQNLPSPPGWKLIREGRRPVFGQSWQYRYTARRREYVQSPAMDADEQEH